MSTSDDNYIGVLLEQIRDQNKALLEAAANQATRDDIYRLEGRVTSIEQDIKVIKGCDGSEQRAHRPRTPHYPV